MHYVFLFTPLQATSNTLRNQGIVSESRYQAGKTDGRDELVANRGVSAGILAFILQRVKGEIAKSL